MMLSRPRSAGDIDCERHEFFRDDLLGKARVEQPSFEVRHVPSVEGDLLNAMLVEDVLQISDVFVADRAPGVVCR